MNKYDKSLKVIQSCHTLEQLEVARRYLNLALPNNRERLLHLDLAFELMSAGYRIRMIGGHV